MKKLLIILISIAILSGCRRDEKSYCGEVVEMYRTDAGYKSSPEAHVVFYCDALNRNVDVEVTFNAYANIKLNQNVCFSLTEYDLQR